MFNAAYAWLNGHSAIMFSMSDFMTIVFCPSILNFFRNKNQKNRDEFSNFTILLQWNFRKLLLRLNVCCCCVFFSPCFVQTNCVSVVHRRYNEYAIHSVALLTPVWPLKTNMQSTSRKISATNCSARLVLISFYCCCFVGVNVYVYVWVCVGFWEWFTTDSIVANPSLSVQCRNRFECGLSIVLFVYAFNVIVMVWNEKKKITPQKFRLNCVKFCCKNAKHWPNNY